MEKVDINGMVVDIMRDNSEMVWEKVEENGLIKIIQHIKVIIDIF
jgi:hypothetical protein